VPPAVRAAERVARPAVLAGEGTLERIGRVFIDCRWPERYLPG